MLNPRLNNCIDCNSIPNLIGQIDNKLTQLANKQYNTIIFGFNSGVSEDTYLDLLNYKRILTYKYCNDDYASAYTVENIASKIKILLFK